MYHLIGCSTEAGANYVTYKIPSTDNGDEV